jgi:CRISPR system Cascade subunit CasB
MADNTRWNKIAAQWWRELNPENQKDQLPNARAALARLRRCTSLAQAATIPEALDLARRLGVVSTQQTLLERALLTAMVLAHVRDDDPKASAARQLGRASAEARAVVSPLRFARLLSAESTAEQLIAFRRAVALLGGTVNVASLAEASMNWSEKTRIAWAFDYHAVPSAGAQPDATTAQPAVGDSA